MARALNGRFGALKACRGETKRQGLRLLCKTCRGSGRSLFVGCRACERQAEGASFAPAAAAVGRLSFYYGALPAPGAGLAYEPVARLQASFAFLCGRLCLGFWCLSHFRGHLLLEVFGGERGYAVGGVVCQHAVDDGRYLLFQFFDELACIIFPVLYVAQFLLPDAGKFAAFEQSLP